MAVIEVLPDQIQAVADGQEGEQHAQHAHRAQRPGGERGQAGQRQACQLAQVEAAPAAGAWRDVVGHRDRIEADPGIQALHEAIALGQREQRVDDLAVHQAEIASAGWNVEAVGGVDQRVEHARAPALDARFARAVGAQGVDHLRTAAPGAQERGDRLGRVLQVGVHRQHHVAAGGLQAGHQCGLLAEIARQRQAAQSGLGSPGLEQRGGAVTAAVVDDDDFPVIGARGQQSLQLRQQQRQVRGLVKGRDHAAQAPRTLAPLPGGLRCIAARPDQPGVLRRRRRTHRVISMIGGNYAGPPSRAGPGTKAGCVRPIAGDGAPAGCGFSAHTTRPCTTAAPEWR